MFNNHSMSLVTDLRILGDNIKNTDYLVVASVSDVNDPIINSAAILMPPTEMLMRWADGDPFIINNGYPQYLASCRDADQLITALLAILINKDVVLHIPVDEFGIFGMQLMNYIYFNYGVTMNTPNTQFAFDQTKKPIILSKFYLYDMIDGNTLLQTYPACMLPEFVINKLATELHPFNTPATFQQYAEYFNSIVMNNNKPKETITMAKKVEI